QNKKMNVNSCNIIGNEKRSSKNGEKSQTRCYGQGISPKNNTNCRNSDRRVMESMWT
ncbi:hypothetical protein NDU88_002573, partial [Pleurodeles waltl]